MSLPRCAAVYRCTGCTVLHLSSSPKELKFHTDGIYYAIQFKIHSNVINNVHFRLFVVLRCFCFHLSDNIYAEVALIQRMRLRNATTIFAPAMCILSRLQCICNHTFIILICEYIQSSSYSSSTLADFLLHRAKSSFCFDFIRDPKKQMNGKIIKSVFLSSLQ